jgi:hypothetical protein
MSELIPVTEAMFEDIRTVLAAFSSPPSDSPLWRNLLTQPWPVEEDHRGYALMDKGNAVGFIGMIFARREIAGRTEKFCNISSIVTLEEHRHEGMSLMLPVLKLEDYTITNFTPTPAVSAIFNRLGFETLDDTMHILMPVPGWPKSTGAPGGRRRIVTRLPSIRERLSEEDRKIFDHHQLPNCWQILIDGPDDYCLVVFNRTKGRKYAFSFVHYMSNPAIFFSCLNRVKLTMALKSRTPFIMVMDRHVKGQPLGRTRTSTIKHKALFKSPTLKREQIDSLYSELVLLNL